MSPELQMQSDLVVISWWSNCLGLGCLHNFVTFATGRRIFFVQVGKTESQKECFRKYLPPGVIELPYPSGLSAEDWRVREVVARELLGDHEGLWFIDHDLFVQEEMGPWLDEMDRCFAQSNACLSYSGPRNGPSITNPAFWLSPTRFPPGMPSFASIPYRENPIASRPYEFRQRAEMIMPEKDTLIAVQEFLSPKGMVYEFPLSTSQAPQGSAPFPVFEHLGGLYTFTCEIIPGMLSDWVSRCVDQFLGFYEACPPEWVASEDPVLLQRVKGFQRIVLAQGAA
jgi:hypothetical protein